MTEQEVKEAAEELSDNRGEEDLDRNLVEREVERINQKLSIYRNNPVGSMTQEKRKWQSADMILSIKQHVK